MQSAPQTPPARRPSIGSDHSGNCDSEEFGLATAACNITLSDLNVQGPPQRPSRRTSAITGPSTEVDSDVESQCHQHTSDDTSFQAPLLTRSSSYLPPQQPQRLDSSTEEHSDILSLCSNSLLDSSSHPHMNCSSPIGVEEEYKSTAVGSSSIQSDIHVQGPPHQPSRRTSIFVTDSDLFTVPEESAPQSLRSNSNAMAA